MVSSTGLSSHPPSLDGTATVGCLHCQMRSKVTWYSWCSFDPSTWELGILKQKPEMHQLLGMETFPYSLAGRPKATIQLQVHDIVLLQIVANSGLNRP